MWIIISFFNRHFIATLGRLPRTEVAISRLCFPAAFFSQKFCHKYVEVLYNT